MSVPNPYLIIRETLFFAYLVGYGRIPLSRFLFQLLDGLWGASVLLLVFM
jgi:hypothetical protein